MGRMVGRRPRLTVGVLLGPRRRRRWVGPLALAAVPAFATNLGHVCAVAADRLATFATDLGHVLAIFADGGSALASDLCHVWRSPLTASPPLRPMRAMWRRSWLTA